MNQTVNIHFQNMFLGKGCNHSKAVIDTANENERCNKWIVKQAMLFEFSYRSSYRQSAFFSKSASACIFG